MGNQKSPTDAKTDKMVYDHGQVSVDPVVSSDWTDELEERINLRMPEWMYEAIEREAQQQRSTPTQTARELLEYALMTMPENWHGINAYGRHTYGDIRCPNCGNARPLTLRWSNTSDDTTPISCKECGIEFHAETGRKVKNLDPDLTEIWFTFAFNHWEDNDPHTMPHYFEQFIEDPREFVENVEWKTELSDVDKSLESMMGDVQTEKEEVYDHLESWEEQDE